MIARILIILVISVMLVSLYAQDTLPVNSAMQYEVQADSLLKSNQPQNLQIIISCNSSAGLNFYEIKINGLKVLWTLVSAKLNEQPVWLVNSNTRTDNNKVLAWYYDSEQSLLRLYPAEWEATYVLDLTVSASILQPAKLSKSDSKLVSLEADLGGQKFTCVTTESGGEMTFKRKIQGIR